jgi:RNA polymerase sigma-70 factor (ECF subfamily)
VTAPTLDRPANWTHVEAAAGGDREAFGLIWQAYHPRILAYVLRRVDGRANGEDIASDVFVRALAGIGHVEWQGRDIGAWLITIARNLVADHYKSARIRTTNLYPEMWSLDTPDPTDVAKLGTDQPIAVRLWQAVSQLPPDQRDCMRLRYADGLSVLEVAAAMGSTEGTVKALSYRARLGLRRRLALTGLAEAVV